MADSAHNEIMSTELKDSPPFSPIELSPHLIVKEDSPEYDHSEYAKMQKDQIARGLPFIILKVDFDNSLYSPATEQEAVAVMNLAHKYNCAVDIVTGNSSNGLIEKLKSARLPFPQVISSQVGTEIQYLVGYEQNGDPIYEVDSAYQRMVDESGYDKKSVIASGRETILEYAILHPDWRLDFQKKLPEDQVDPEPHKLSFYFYARPDEFKKATTTLRSKFAGNEVVTCGEIGYNESHKGEPVQKYCVDVLPVTKNTAMKYLGEMSKFKAAGNPNLEFVLKLGDSGNDQFLGEQTDENELSVLAGGATLEAKHLADLITTPNDLERSFRHAGTLNDDARPADRALYAEQKPGIIATQSLIRSGRMALLGALRNPTITPATKEYLGSLYRDLTDIEKQQK